jgi:CubicO group peptidase (beta-lactamase class C family)
MAKIIPDDFVLDDEYLTTHVTIRDALSHRTGLSGHGVALGAAVGTLKQNTRNMRHLFTAHEIRTTWDYCNHMFIAVSHAIEVLSSQTLGTFWKEKIWNPLGMKQTFYSFAEAHDYVRKNKDVVLSKGYRWDYETEETVVVPYWDDSGVGGAGCIVSNVTDYAKWIQSFINQSGPLSAAGYSTVTSPLIAMPSEWNTRVTGSLFYGMGWMIGVYRGERIIYHPGGTDSFVANMVYLPDRKWGVVGMVNASNNAVMNAPLYHLIDDFLGIPEEQRVDDGLAK